MQWISIAFQAGITTRRQVGVSTNAGIDVCISMQNNERPFRWKRKKIVRRQIGRAKEDEEERMRPVSSFECGSF
jgi:hypothetical protein